MTVELELPPGPAYEVVGRLVLGGLGARLGIGTDRITDFQHALHAALQRQPSGRTLVVRMKSTPEDLRVSLGPFDGASAPDGHVPRVAAALVDQIATHRSGEEVWVDMRVTRDRLPLPG